MDGERAYLPIQSIAEVEVSFATGGTGLNNL
jgi:hypothetical protein